MVLVTRTVYGAAGARMLVLPAVSTSRGEMGDEDENVLETTVKKMREKRRRMCRKREGEKKKDEGQSRSAGTHATRRRLQAQVKSVGIKLRLSG